MKYLCLCDSIDESWEGVGGLFSMLGVGED